MTLVIVLVARVKHSLGSCLNQIAGVLNASKSVAQPQPQGAQSLGELFENNKIEELKAVFATAPQRAKNIVKILQNPGNLQTGKFKYMFFVGAPGTGKTTTAQAIAYQMVTQSGWGYKCMTATDIVGGFRNQAAERLRQILEAISQNLTPMLVIIDELNKILDHSESKDHDTDTVATVLWNFLDKQNFKPFFFIGLMNCHTKIPEAFKSRVTLRSVEFTELNELAVKRNAFDAALLSVSAQLHPDISSSEVSAALDLVTSVSGRDLSEIAFRLSELSWQEDDTQTTFIVTRAHLAKIFAEFSRCVKRIKRGVIEETNEERQERHHKENLERGELHFKQQQAQQDIAQQNNQALQEKHFAMQYSLQKKAQDMQAVNFVQQQLIQMQLAENQERKIMERERGKMFTILESNYTHRTELDVCNPIRNISDAQWDLYSNHMKSTVERRVRRLDEEVAQADREAKEEEQKKRAQEAANKEKKSGWWG
jgi:AAA+ superfamily predicted ATPase